jgi:iron(III) transport system substrate-binding protein
MSRKPTTLLLIAILLLTVAVTLSACAQAAQPPAQAPADTEALEPAPSGELVVYSGRREQFVTPLIERFETETGITVRLLTGSASEYALRIMDEARNPQADIFFANDAGVMERLRLEGLLTPYDSPAVQTIPADMRAADGSWVGLSARSRVLIYNLDLISEDEMPQSIMDLADPRYKEMFAITRAGSEAMISHLAALRLLLGDEAVETFIRGMLANEPAILSGHTDIRKAVGAGEFAFGLVNNYYYHLQLLEDEHNNVGAIYTDQGDGEIGAFVNVAGVALIKGAPNAANAQAFVEFLLRPEQQAMFAELNYETPVLPGIPVVDIARPIDSYRRSAVSLSDLGPIWEDTIELMERAGYTE